MDFKNNGCRNWLMLIQSYYIRQDRIVEMIPMLYPLFSRGNTNPTAMIAYCNVCTYTCTCTVSRLSINNDDVSTAIIIIPEHISIQCQYSATILPRMWVIL